MVVFVVCLEVSRFDYNREKTKNNTIKQTEKSTAP